MVQRVSDRMTGRRGGGMAGIWQQVRSLGIVVPGRDLVAPRALNPEELPLQLTEEGQIVYVTEVQFDYRGPATSLQVGVGWKITTPLDFNNGLNLLSNFRYAWTLPVAVLESVDWVTYREELWSWGGEASLFAPVIGNINMTLGGDLYSVGYGDTVDAWIWIYDATVLGLYAYSPDTEFLAIDTDADVIRMPEEVVPESAVRDLDVRYELR